MTKAILPETQRQHKAAALPHIPWPLPATSCDIEICRWCYGSSAQRKGGEWVYLVHISIWDSSPDAPIVEASIEGFRIREDYITKRRYDAELLPLGQELEVNRKVKRPPRELMEAWTSFVLTIRERAERDRRRYEKIMEAQPWW